MALVVSCDSCGKKMKAPVALAGKRVRCKCGERLQVPFPHEPVASPKKKPQPAAIPSESDPQPADLTDLAALADGEGVASGRHCPECFANMPDDGVLCTSCGYDSRTGKKFQAAAGPADEAAGAKPKKAAKPGKSKNPEDAKGAKAAAALAGLIKPVMILLLIAGFFGAAWYIKGAIFFDPKTQLNDDHARVYPGMTVKQVVTALDKKPSVVEAPRPASQAKDLLGKLTPRRLPYKDNFIKQYSKEDLQFGFTFIYNYSERDQLIIEFTHNGRVISAFKHDPLERLGL